MRFAMLGPLDVRDDDGRAVEVGGARLRAVLIRLALDAGRVVTVEALIDGVWGESPPAGAVNAMQSLVSRLRRALSAGTSGAELIESLPAGYRLLTSADDVDALRFERLADDGRRALGNDPEQAAAVLREALALWRGDALADVAEAPFAGAHAARLAERRLAAVEDRIAADLTLGRHADVLVELEALAAAHPLRERLRVQLVTALYRCGRQADALAAYEQTRRLLADELGIDPSAELSAVHLAVLRRDPGLLPPTQVSPPPTNLRATLTSFVGRDAEVALVGKLLGEARLVTLVGPGGTGKTRLATESATGLAGNENIDGVWLVELAPVRDPLDLAQSVLAVLSPRKTALLERPQARRDPRELLIGALREQRVLLVLDNCEHLVAAAADLAHDLLSACPELRILATSREPLGITGETVCPVPPLGLPPAGSTPGEALDYPAVRLFADRAAAARLGFTVDAGNVASVAEICRQLDGAPLAIELAAARLRSLSVEQITARLTDRFRLLTGGSRTALPRHQTLRAVVEWSWDLLSEPERVLARRLSVFPGGATLESAEHVCGLPPDQVLDLLAALVDKSLVEAVHAEEAETEPRYRMLETVRVYSAERLDEAGETEAFRAAQARYMLELAETADPLLRTGAQIGWLSRLSAEHDNLRATLRWAVDGGHAETAVRLAAALGWSWTLRGDHTEGAAWLGEAMAVPGETPRPARAIGHAFLALHSAVAGDPTVGSRELEAALLAAEGLDQPGAHPILWMLPAAEAMVQDDDIVATRALDRMIALADPWTQAIALVARAFVGDNVGDAAGAERDFALALGAFTELDDQWGMSTSLGGLAGVRELHGDYAGAITALDQAIELMSSIGYEDDMMHVRTRRALVLARSGDLDAAMDGLDQAAQAGRHASRDGRLLLAASRGEVARRGGDLEDAYRWYLVAMDDAETFSEMQGQFRALVLIGIGYVELDRGNLPAAVARLRDGLENALAAKDMPIVSAAADGLGVAAQATDDPTRAAVLFGAATRLRGTADLGNPDVVAARDAARAALGVAAYDAAYAQAASLGRVAAIALVLGADPRE